MTTVRLVDPCNSAYGYDKVFAQHRPAILVAYNYLRGFVDAPHRPFIRDWSLDSGAFSAFTQGKTVDRDAFHETARMFLATDPKLVEVFALDVIGDWRASLRNAEAAWCEGIPAMPTYHVGDPSHVLDVMARDYPKIALGGAVRYSKKLAWAEQCFARIWPKPVHGLGFNSLKAIMRVPFHSVDSSNWVTQPCNYGKWNHLGKASGRVAVYGPKTGMMEGPVRAERQLEDKARMRWAKEMAMLDEMLTEANWRGVSA